MSTAERLQRLSFFWLTAWVMVIASGVPSRLFADTVTLPVATSATGRGGVPFVSDVRVFNTSYTDTLNVTATYRVNGAAQAFQLGPREARGFDDICANLFATPQSLGAVDFTSDKNGLLVVTSQLRSPASGGGHVGMFVPGLPSSAAAEVTVLTSLANGESRTNVGMYNPNAVAVTATIRLFDGPVLLGTKAVALGAHATVQVNDIYGVLGFGSLVRTDGYATVESSVAQAPLFTYAAEADNQSGDLILVVGAADVPAPEGFNPPTPSATPPASTPTPTSTAPPPSPTPTVTAPAVTIVNLVASRFQWSFAGGGNAFTMHVGQTYRLVITDGDSDGAAHGFGGVAALGISAVPLRVGGTPMTVTFTPTSSQIGSHFFACDQPSCGSGHGDMIATIQIMP